MESENQLESLLSKLGEAPVVYVSFMEASERRTVPTDQGGLQLARAMNLLRACGRVTLLVSVQDDWIAEGADAYLSKLFGRFGLKSGEPKAVQVDGPEEPQDPPLYIYDLRYRKPRKNKNSR